MGRRGGPTRWWVAVAVATAALAGSCGDSGGGSSDPTLTSAPSGGRDGQVAGEVVVFAAASLTDAFAEVEAAFTDSHPEVSVTLNLAGSSALREQVLDGAPADVFASASEPVMAELVEAGEVATGPTTFARNRLAIAVPAGNPAGIRGLADFGDDDRLLGLCAEGVPCGDFARQVLERAGVEPAVDTDEPDVRALLTKVAAGELDAGIVYATDIASAGGDVDAVEIPAADNVEAAYPIAQLRGAPNPAGAAALVDFVLSPDGRAILARHGFLAP